MAGILNFALEKNLIDDVIFMLCRVSKSQEGMITRKALDITTLSERQCLCNFRLKAQDLTGLHQLLKPLSLLLPIMALVCTALVVRVFYCGGWCIHLVHRNLEVFLERTLHFIVTLQSRPKPHIIGVWLLAVFSGPDMA